MLGLEFPLRLVLRLTLRSGIQFRLGLGSVLGLEFMFESGTGLGLCSEWVLG